MTFTIPAITGGAQPRAWLVGWNGNWASAGGTTHPGIELNNYTVSGTMFSVNVTGYNQQLYGITVSYVVNMASGSMTTYEQLADYINISTTSSGSGTFTLPAGQTTPNFVGITLAGLVGFQFTRNNPWSWNSSTTLTGTTSIPYSYAPVANTTSPGIMRMKLQQTVYLRIFCLNTSTSVNLARTACVSTCDAGTFRDACGYCVSCNPRCATCVGTGVDDCLTCDSAIQIRVINGTVGSCGLPCVCQPGYY